ncbi:hypothetical protein [Clostridium saccharobutylicum]|uniref:Uncharacterized protein n=1 Tax=Clostridium saccharobutylicum TaxID=169679 RepID=A0A1S8NDC2_CLOSA|nr:hypothetical protein [Clostridium saccharobutylicum]OOM14261.1 hypothetical protein CLOSAC_11340 [Clostridium saccharobutylicum]
MENNVYISLKSGKEIEIKDFQYVTYPSPTNKNDITIVKAFENFYLYNKHFTFVGKHVTLSLNSNEIEFVKFLRTSNN